MYRCFQNIQEEQMPPNSFRKLLFFFDIKTGKNIKKAKLQISTLHD